MSDTWKERAEQAERALAALREAHRLPAVCIHDEEPDYCDGCRLIMERAIAAALASLPPPATPETQT